MTLLPISLTMASVAALINIWLGARVGKVRSKEKIFVGDGGNEAVIRRMRAQANYIENTSFVLILILLVELASGSTIWLWAAGGIYMVGRVAHAFGMDGVMKARFAGTLITMLTQLGLAIAALAILWLTPAGVTLTEVETVTTTQQ